MERIVLTGPRGLLLRCDVPERRLERMRGLMRHERLDRPDALLLRDTTSIHTVGMRFPLLVARLDRSLVVVDVRRLAPRRVLLPIARAVHVLECSVDVDLRPGDVLHVARTERPSDSAGPTRSGLRPGHRVAPLDAGDGRSGGGYTASAAPGARAPIV